MNKNVLNYIIYGIIALIVIIGLVLLFGGEEKKEEPKKEDPVVEELVLENQSINVNVDETVKINAYVNNNPNAVITYYSSNNSIATVDSTGNVLGKENGTASIIISYNSTTGTKLTKQCYVNVAGGVEITSIILPKGELLISRGATYKLNPQVSPEEYDISKLKYKASNNSVINVSKDGTIEALSNGLAVVRVQADDNIFADMTVRVIDDSTIGSRIAIMPESITTMNKVTMKVDEEKELVYTVNPEDADKSVISLKSNDTSIVSINNNKLKALAEGNTTITLETLNGIKTDISIVVKPNIIEVTSLNITSSQTLSIKVGETSQISYDVKPSNATDRTVSFQSSNTSVATVSQSGLITAVANGTATIKVVTNNGMKTKQISITVTGGSSGSSSDSSSSSSSGSSYCKLGTKVGTIDSELLTSPTDTGFDKCKSRSRNLVPYINGTNYGQDGSYVMKVGETLTVNVKLPTMCGKIDTLTRTNHDGQSGWSEYVSQSSSPKVNRNDTSTYVSGATGYTWKITAKKKGCVTVSQTAQFDVTSPSGRRGNMKSMIRLHIKIED